MSEARFWLPLDSRHRVLVRIFPTLKSMREAKRRLSSDSTRNTLACFIEPAIIKTIRGRITTTHVAYLLFCQKALGAGIVAHELYHLYLMWAHYKGWRGYDSPDEETCAGFIQKTTETFWTRYYRLFPHTQPAQILKV